MTTEEIKQEEEDMQEKIDEANEKIENGETVNESDFGDHDVEFKDENGNLDSSVEEITTDGTGAVSHDEPLPDPNVTGEEFDKNTEPTDNYHEEESSNDHNCGHQEDSSASEESHESGS